MRTDIIEYLERDIKEKCESPNNFFGMGGYYHIKAVVKNAVGLAEKYGADIEIVTIAAWLHDVGSIIDYKNYEEHHLVGARMAGDLLKSMDYPKEKIELVQKCILNHRGSDIRCKCSLEEICVADADAISHFDSIPSLFYLAYVRRGYSIDDGTNFVVNKLNRSFAKLSDKSKSEYQQKYLSVMNTICDK